MQLWATIVLCFAPRQLGVCNGLELRSKLDLIQHYLLSSNILDMPHTTVGEDVLFYLQLAEYGLQLFEMLLDLG